MIASEKWLECFSVALDSFREPLFMVSSDGELIFANSALHGFLKLKSSLPSEILLKDFWPQFEPEMLRVSDLSAELCSPDGLRFAVKLALVGLGYNICLCRVVSGISRDETLHNFQSHRLETLGLLAGGVAHDFNNVLAGILGHITYLKTILPSRGSHCESLLAIEDGAKKASSLTQQILGFTRQESAEKIDRVNIGDLAKGTCKLLRGAISPEYSLDFSAPDKPIWVLAVEGKIAQVLVNLVVNARDAIKADGEIRVLVDLVSDEVELKSAFDGVNRGAKAYCKLQVCDNGHGMSKELQSKIFEPYFSTKKDKGTGLGLAVVKEIVELFGGAIVISSEVGKGTQINVYFPTVEDSARHTFGGANKALPLERGSEKILIVDDECPVRNVLLVSLQHLGYKVETAANGEEALEKFRDTVNTNAHFDLVLLDMIMPHMPGEEVFRELQEIDPQVQVLVISGFSSEEAVKFILARGGLGFLQKPFTIEELSKQVRHCLVKGHRHTHSHD